MFGITSSGRRDREHEEAIEELLQDTDEKLFELEEEVLYSPAEDLVSDLRHEDAAAMADWFKNGEGEVDLNGLLEEEPPVAPGFRREPKQPGVDYTGRVDIFEKDPSPGEKREDPWHSPLYEREEYEPPEYRHALVA